MEWFRERREREGDERGEPDERDERDDDREERLIVRDAFFYGARTQGFSYGRLPDGFGFLRPTPGSPNEGPFILAPRLLADGGVEVSPARKLKVAARVTRVVPGLPPDRVVLHYRFDDRWRQKKMTLEPLEAGGPTGRATATLQAPALAREVSYYFVATVENGLERRAPLDAPAGVYRHELR